MKLAMKSINPKNLFRSKKPPTTTSSISKSSSLSEPSSFNTTTSTSSYDTSSERLKNHFSTTPTSVLPPSRSPTTTTTPNINNELISAFRLIDHDNDGKINIHEMKSLLTRITPVQEEITAMLTEIDRDGNGCISIDEFEAISTDAFEAAVKVDKEDELKEAFDVFDTDQDGRITGEELMSVFEAIGYMDCTIEECKRMIESVDLNGDGFVCFDDFCRMMDQSTVNTMSFSR